MSNPAPPFEEVSEAPGVPVSPDAASMLYTRYRAGAEVASGARVLELACGAGPGLGMLARHGRSVVAADYSRALLHRARAHYGRRIPFVRLSAESLPFADASFDTVLFFEATYYVPDMERAFDEIGRVLAPGGLVLFVNANPERRDFIRSPYAVRYHTAAEFRDALERRGLRVDVAGAFPIQAARRGAGRRMITWMTTVARRVLETFGLVPKTLRGRARLKRLVYRNLRPIPPELEDGFAPEAPRVPLENALEPVRGYKVLYVTGRR